MSLRDFIEQNIAKQGRPSKSASDRPSLAELGPWVQNHKTGIVRTILFFIWIGTAFVLHALNAQYKPADRLHAESYRLGVWLQGINTTPDSVVWFDNTTQGVKIFSRLDDCGAHPVTCLLNNDQDKVKLKAASIKGPKEELRVFDQLVIQHALKKINPNKKAKQADRNQWQDVVNDVNHCTRFHDGNKRSDCYNATYIRPNGVNLTVAGLYLAFAAVVMLFGRWLLKRRPDQKSGAAKTTVVELPQ